MIARTLIVYCLVGLTPLFAQDALKNVENSGSRKFENDPQKVAEELADPNTILAVLTFKNQLRVFEGSLPNADGQTGFATLFQPSMPIPLDSGRRLFLRPAIPIIWNQSVFDADSGRFRNHGGLGDIGFDVTLGNSNKSGFISSYGFSTSLPTATSSELGTGQWSLGPKMFLGRKTKRSVLGFSVGHLWDVAGWSDLRINRSNMQITAIFLPGGGWNFGFIPQIDYDWDTDEWTIPLNLTFGKTMIFNERPWRINLEVNYYLESPETFGPEWMIGLNISPVVKNRLATWLKGRR